MRHLAIGIFLFFIVNSGFCQQDSVKFVNHYIGVQVNELLRQLINLNENDEIIDNPYLFTYSVFTTQGGWGLQGGFGFNYHQIKDNISVTAQESKISDFFYRAGIAKQFHLGRRWTATTGLDYTGSYLLDKTFASQVTFNFNHTTKDSTTTITTTTSESNGGGAQFRIAYAISRHIEISTESTLYFTMTRNKSNVTLSEVFTNSVDPDQDSNIISASNSDTKESEFIMTLPVAIFLIIKF
jgi:hypothetical protein